MTVRTRIAPSPTGSLHIGTARSALFNYLFAKQQGGAFILRIEDTDAARNRPEYEEDIREQLAWLGLPPDEVYKQSERKDSHTKAIEQLIRTDHAYVSREPAKDDPEREVAVVRLRNPNTTISFDDAVRGSISFDTTELGDMVIARSVDDPLYHLAVVVDDAEMNITHVIRGEDHISNTPRQILIQEALGVSRPLYAHMPLILMPDKSKMSKRKHETAIAQFRTKGFLPDAFINYLALLGWNPGTDEELFSMEELIKTFDLSHIHKSGAIFNEEKLRWFNREYLLNLDENTFREQAEQRMNEVLRSRVPTVDPERISLIIPLVRERISTWGDIDTLAESGEFDYFFTPPKDLSPEALIWKKSTKEAAAQHLQAITDMLQEAPESAFDSVDTLKPFIWDYAEEHGRGDVLWPFRYALTGREKSPDPFSVATLLGKEETLMRVKTATQLLK